MDTRRTFLGRAAALAMTAAVSACARPETPARAAVPDPAPVPPPFPPLPARYGAITDEPFPVPAIPEGVVPPELWRQRVESLWPNEVPGTILVDPDAGLLHLIEEGGTAMRYGAGTGRAAFAWSGEARLQFRRKWPRWTPPDSMIERQPELEPFSVANGGMDPGPGNPLGARALYLFQNGEDTLYRIHGACEPEYLGQAVSSGCVRLLDQDVIDLHDRVRDGAKVVVFPSMGADRLRGVW